MNNAEKFQATFGFYATELWAMSEEEFLKWLNDASHGEWVDDGDPLTLACGTCGYRVMRYNNTKFCPDCGMRLEG